MEFYYLRCRSVTFARRASRLLEGVNIKAPVVRLPQKLTDTGCGYALKIRQRNIDDALTRMRKYGLEVTNIYGKTGDTYFEVAL